MMTNEEMQAKIASVKNFDDAYKMACEGGYTGSAEDFAALVVKAADEINPMSMDAMESVAGGFGMDDVKSGFNTAVDYVSGACSGAVNWVKENPVLTTEIVGGVALVGIAVGTSVYAYKTAKKNQELKVRAMGLNQQEWEFSKYELLGKTEGMEFCAGWQYYGYTEGSGNGYTAGE